MRKLTTKEFINKAVQVHGDKYEYFNLCYKGGKHKVNIICKEHGEFAQFPGNHLSGNGCKKCNLITTQSFKTKTNIVHNNKYKYDFTIYTNSSSKVIITCPIHGNFKQTAGNHLNGSGCRSCANDNHLGSWRYSNWNLTAKKSKNFDSFKVYIIKCYNDNEEFYKIGKTFQTLDRRFHSNRLMPYYYEVIKIIEGDCLSVSKLENKLKNKNKIFKYKPLLSFGGQCECFSSLT